MNSKLVKKLESEGLLSKSYYKTLVKDAKKTGRFFSDILLESAPLEKSEKLLSSLADFFNFPTTTLRDKRIHPKVLNLIPKEVAEQYSVIIFKKVQDVIFVATASPENQQIVEFIKRRTGLVPKIFLASPKEIKHALCNYDTEISEEFAKIIESSTREALAIHSSADRLAEYLPVIKMVNTIIDRALFYNASDIHIEPHSNQVVIRFRIDGLLHTMVKLPREMLSAIITRIKLMANLKIDEHRVPQDGRFQYNSTDDQIAVRVSVIPTLYGPKVALRLLNNEQRAFTLRKLGLNRRDFALLKNEINSTQGMILVTGPTGSGKTTTLYTVLQMLNKESVNICTVEDPIEYGIDGINQTQINARVGMTFATGLRSLLRQDPNIVMVGEIRDLETAEMAVNAAMTGHLVLTTLHTNNSFLAPQRMIEMGIQPFLVSSVVNIVIAQRLVRKICPDCKMKLRSNQKHFENFSQHFDFEAIFAKLKSLNLLPSDMTTDQIVLYRGRGCVKCNYSGYRGRVGVYEMYKMDQDIKNVILKHGTEFDIKKAALKQGTLTMAEDGIYKVFSGRTTFEEIVRVTQE